MGKSADAFRTISEVAEWLEVPAHVLRFWESKFTQVKPVKRAGGRRYYRPSDMRLLGGIKVLLHDEGMTIKGVQKMLREQGVRHVAALSPAFVAETTDAAIGAEGDDSSLYPAAQVLSFASPKKPTANDADTPQHDTASDAQERQEPETAEEAEAKPTTDPQPAPMDETEPAAPPPSDPPPEPDTAAESQQESLSEPEAEAEAEAEAEPQPEIDASPEPQETSTDTAEPGPAALAPLPDLPDDPPDDMAAPPGPLTRLATLSRPLPEGLAPTLAALALRLREAGEPKA